MKRRQFITLLGGAAAWPMVAWGQKAAVPVVGFLSDASAAPYEPFLAAFRAGLAEAGFVEGQNVVIASRWADGHHDRLPALAIDLVQRRVAVIVCSGGNFTVPPAMAATKTIPIIFTMGGDPVRAGFVTSLNRPGGNVTGVAQLSSTLLAKHVELIQEVVPSASVIGFLESSGAADGEEALQTVRDASRSIGANIVVGRIGSENDIDGAFAEVAMQHANAAILGGGAFLTSRSDHLAALELQYRLPTIYARSEFPRAGGLIGYGPSLAGTYQQVGIYAGRVLNGDRPADLPVVQPTKFELVINLKTAKTLGLTVPPTLLATADEVIE